MKLTEYVNIEESKECLHTDVDGIIAKFIVARKDDGLSTPLWRYFAIKVSHQIGSQLLVLESNVNVVIWTSVRRLKLLFDYSSLLRS